MEQFNQIKEQFLNVWKKLSTPQKTAFISVIAAFVIIITVITIYSGSAHYVKLYPRISEEEAGQIAAALDERGAKYEPRAGAIYVKSTERDHLLLQLSGEGIVPKGGIMGYELLDGITIGRTEFEREKAYHRAVEGEIIRTLRGIKGVNDVRLSIAFPKPALYTDQAEPVTASIMLNLASFTQLTSNQVKEIVKFVSYAVEGLQPANVSVTDQRLTPLTPDFDDGDGIRTAKDMETRKQIEKEFERKLMRDLGRILTPDKVTVAVNVDMDFDKFLQETEKHSRPGFEQLMESQEIKKIEFEGTGIKPGGTPGVAANVPGYEEVSEMPVSYSENEARTNYLTDIERAQLERAPYIKRLTASVNVDGHYEETFDDKGNLQERKYVARSPEFLDNVKEVVSASIGYSEKRNDIVAVTNIAFDRTEQFSLLDKMRAEEMKKRQLVLYSLLGSVLFILFLLLMLELKKFMELKYQARRARQSQLTPTAEGIGSTITLAEQEKLELRRRAEKASKETPELVANLLKTWLGEDE